MNPHTLIIEPGLADRHYWRDLWRYRELFYVLAWRDIAVRYKQTVIGLAWALMRPLLTMIVFTVVFGNLARMPTEGTAPYALLVFAGLLPWQFFSTALTESSNSLIGNANLISKVYFPRLIVPTAAVVVSFVDFLISFAILVLVMVWYQFLPGWRILTLPFFVLMAFLASLGPGLWITALNVKYRDFRYIIPFIVTWGSTSPRWASARPSSRSNGDSSTRSTRWSASSTASAGPSSAARSPSTGPASS